MCVICRLSMPQNKYQCFATLSFFQAIMVDFHLYVVLQVAYLIYFDNDELELNFDCDQLFHKFIHLERVLDLRPASQFRAATFFKTDSIFCDRARTGAVGPLAGKSVQLREFSSGVARCRSGGKAAPGTNGLSLAHIARGKWPLRQAAK